VNSSVQIGDPKRFRWREILVINAINIVPGFVLGASGAAASLCLAGAFLAKEYQFLLLAIGAAAVVVFGLGLFLWPVAVGNLYVRRIAKGSLDRRLPGSPSYICQISFLPRLHGGFRGFMEDADDVGHLQITDEVLSFTGDHVCLLLRLDCIQGFTSHNVGWRGMWLAGKRIRITTSVVDGVNSLELCERQSGTVVSSQRISAEIIQELRRRIQRVGGADPRISGGTP